LAERERTGGAVGAGLASEPFLTIEESARFDEDDLASATGKPRNGCRSPCARNRKMILEEIGVFFREAEPVAAMSVRAGGAWRGEAGEMQCNPK